MGTSHSVVTALQSLLRQRNLKVSTKTLNCFVREVDRVAPWYACSGSLMLASWEKLERDLIREQQAGKLKAGTMPLWKLVKSCLEDEKCRLSIKAGQEVLEEIQDSLSEIEWCKRTGVVKSKKGAPKKKGPSKDSRSVEVIDKGKDALGEKGGAETKKGRRESLYPFRELEALNLGNSDDPETDELSPSEEEELEDEVAQHEKERYRSDGAWHIKTGRGKNKGHMTSRLQGPAAPLPYAEAYGSDSFLSQKERRKLQQAFTVFEGEAGARIFAPVVFREIKELAESVRNYWITANFTISLVERLNDQAMTPRDWQTVAKAALPNMGLYMEWKALWYDLLQTQAKANSAVGGDQRQWTFELLTGQGPFANNQTNFAWGAYGQISTAAIRAWKSLSKRGDPGGHLTKIVQGPQEPFSEFVARMTEAAGRIFGDPEQAMPLIEQLIYEQATQECKAAIAPRKSKGLQDWVKVCRELGGPLTNAGLAAAILQSQKGSRVGEQRTCFNCGRTGHLKRDCRAPGKKRVPGVCTRCGKGYHWANECRSVRDIRGRSLQPAPALAGEEGDGPKNGRQGPRSQGPKTYGTATNRWGICNSIEQLRDRVDWTSGPQPDSC
ncbi:igE-binding protein-like [Apodemus sylvaticus]|uniref:igE-binding protein-like n=1 Tax=Apodemus sylvaticus TaxID=10129 RepID=UPI002242F4AF|nr:igE-binding protein-like [Apodemus sylvaticus]